MESFLPCASTLAAMFNSGASVAKQQFQKKRKEDLDFQSFWILVC
jgi:hypothetical protein